VACTGIKRHLFGPRTESAPNPVSLWAEFSANRITVLTSGFVITAAATLRTVLPPELSLAPLFVFGCVLPTLVIGRRWGTMAAVACTVILSLTKIFMNQAPFHIELFLWNGSMRFLFFEFYVVLFDGLRRLARDPSATGKDLST